jgi:hypothetical protein
MPGWRRLVSPSVCRQLLSSPTVQKASQVAVRLLAGVLRAVRAVALRLDSLLATWHVGRSRRNLPPRLEASAGKGPTALGESPRSSFGTREVAKADEARGRPRSGTDDVDIDILRLVELAGF